MTAECEELAAHEQGTYVVQKAIDYCNAPELVSLCEVLIRRMSALTAHPRGVFAMVRALMLWARKCTSHPSSSPSALNRHTLSCTRHCLQSTCFLRTSSSRNCVLIDHNEFAVRAAAACDASA